MNRGVVQGNLLNTILLLLSKLPPEGLVLLETLIRSMLNARDPMVALRITALALASKAGVHKAFDELMRMTKLAPRKGRPTTISAADAKRLVALARDQTG